MVLETTANGVIVHIFRPTLGKMHFLTVLPAKLSVTVIFLRFPPKLITRDVALHLRMCIFIKVEGRRRRG